jgi:RNA polymerase sigma factor (TIGR02999 family)
MSNRTPENVSALIEAAGRGEEKAAERLQPFVYQELRAIAGRLMRRERPGHTLQPTALVHEAFLRLTREAKVPWSDRSFLVAVAVRAMRQVLIEHARRRAAAKRGGLGAERITLDDAIGFYDGAKTLDLLAVHEAIETLRGLHERQARVVELRFFGGLTIPETARVLGVGESTVEDDWVMARTWLGERLKA